MAEVPRILRHNEQRDPHFAPSGWNHWPDHPWLSYQFRRGLGETQEGGGTISECFLAASRMVPDDKESWHREWKRLADSNKTRGDVQFDLGHIATAMSCWLRGADYYRQAEFLLHPEDPRRLLTFGEIENCSAKFLRNLSPPGEILEIPYEPRGPIHAYFVRSPLGEAKQPCLICLGGLDSFKDEMWFMQARGALRRGISVLMIDGPGQGATLRRGGIPTRYDYEVPVGKCVDYLETRDDIDVKRIAICGSSLGGYYAARAGSFEHRLAGVISHGAIWSFSEGLERVKETHGLAHLLKWVFGASNMGEVIVKAREFKLEGVLENVRCPYLIVHGGYDVLGVEQAHTVYDYARSKNVNVILRLVSEEETGADHCQHDNPTLGQEIIGDWLVDLFSIDERATSYGAQALMI